jgi:signal transduction histidine kinase
LAAAFLLWTACFQIGIWLIVPRWRDAVVAREVDDMLMQRAFELRDQVLESARETRGDAAALASLLEPQRTMEDLVVQVWRAGGPLLATSPNMRDAATVPLRDGAGPTPTFTDETLDHHSGPSRARFVTLMFSASEGESYTVQVGMALDAADRVGASLRGMLLIAVVAGTAGAGLAGWIVAGSLVRRLRKVSEAVREVSPTHLQSRVDIPGGSDEIGRMASDINAMLSNLERAFRSQESFISDVSHELKTPVSALLTEAQVLKYTRPKEADYERFVTSVEEEMRRLGKLVESFLMLARFGHGHRFIAQGLVHINDVALESLEHASLLASHHGITISLHLFDAGDDCDEAVVSGDSELLRVVVDNLIRNAVQFSKRGDIVKVTVHCSDHQVTLSVRDHGPGVPADHLDRIFDRFAQAPAQSGARRGTGLGLTIAKGVVNLHGGSIKAENAVGGGCVFTVTLPGAQAQTPGAKPPALLSAEAAP